LSLGVSLSGLGEFLQQFEGPMTFLAKGYALIGNLEIHFWWFLI
jgi:hypothetical protein